MANPMSFSLMDNNPIQIYQDAFASAPMISHAPMPSSAPKPQQQQQQQQQYPHISPDHPVPMTPTNQIIKKAPYMTQFKSVIPMPYGKENGTHPHIYPAPSMPMPMPPFYATSSMAPTKPILLGAAPIKEYRQPKDHHRPAKKIKLDDATTLPPHDSFPHQPDDGQKPSHSYAQLIGMAILRSPNRRLTLSQIYKWISDHFSFYKPGDSGWQNSIRHNLSLHKAFVKMERPKDDPGKGNYWLIDAEQEHVFTKEKSAKKPSSAGENVSVMSTRVEPSAKPAAAGPSSSAAASTSPAVAKTEPPSHQDLPPPLAGASQSSSAAATEPSSETTIPASDAAEEPQQDDTARDHDGQDTSLLSPIPPPRSIHSSPPTARLISALDDATPPGLHAPAGRKRKRASVDDSGYMSAFESSVMRPNKKNLLLTSEGDRPRTKRPGNRAEDEILRIPRMRASSHESPSKGRSRNGAMPPPPPSSSSPICSRSQLMPPPGTPAAKLRARTGCPPSVSPTTNLRNHRHQVSKMLESPFKRVPSLVEDAHPASPIFNLDYLHPGPNFGVESPASGFNIYHDVLSSEDIFSMHAAANGSPVKRSAIRRGRIERTQSASALADITRAASNKGMQGTAQGDITHASVAFSPSKMLDFGSSPTKAFIHSPMLESPTKDMSGQQWGQPDQAEAFFVPPAISQPYEMLSAQPFDMLQGFQKIGSVSSSQAGVPRPAPKPMLGRSYSNIM